jgi:hypothetical protein
MRLLLSKRVGIVAPFGALRCFAVHLHSAMMKNVPNAAGMCSGAANAVT